MRLGQGVEAQATLQSRRTLDYPNSAASDWGIVDFGSSPKEEIGRFYSTELGSRKKLTASGRQISVISTRVLASRF